MKRIIIATDGSDHALKAAEFAGKRAAGMHAELHVLAVAYRDPKSESCEKFQGGQRQAIFKRSQLSGWVYALRW
jgi:nucleotide-binding universal stress UspA family protein